MIVNLTSKLHANLEDDKDQDKVEPGKMRELSSYLEKLLNFHLNLCINHDYIKPLVFQLSFLFFAVSN